MNWFSHSVLGKSRNPRAERGFRPSLEILEERALPSSTTGVSEIVSNFNGNSIPAGDVVWFSSAFKINGNVQTSSPITLDVTNQTITFDGTTVSVPDSHITLTPGQTTASTSFDGAWEVSLPTKFSGNGFLGGAAFAVTTTLPGGINPVTWQATFSSNTAGLNVNWQWGAAVYTKFDTTYAADNIKATDDNHFAPYPNSDHAGTPEAFTSFVTGGARGGGGSNFTGSMSGTASITPPVNQQPSSLSGFVTVQGPGGGPIAGVLLTLTNAEGQVVGTTTTAADGSYSFTGLEPDTYTITETTPSGFSTAVDFPGTVNGNTDGTDAGNGVNAAIGQIILGPANTGINYNFTLIPQQG